MLRPAAEQGDRSGGQVQNRGRYRRPGAGQGVDRAGRRPGGGAAAGGWGWQGSGGTGSVGTALCGTDCETEDVKI